MGEKTKHLYAFGPFLLDPAERLLLRDGQAVTLTTKVFDLLVLLTQNPGRLLEKDEILAALWPESFVEEVNLSVNVSVLRKALGENPARPQYIETVPKKGYRFVAEVAESVVVEVPVTVPQEVTETQPSPTGKGTAAAPQTALAAKVADAGAAIPAREVSVPSRRLVAWLPRRALISIGIVLVLGLGAYLYWLVRGSNREANPADLRTVAVLPFKTATADDADKALGLGMADALITRLGNLPQVTVRPTGAVLKYADSATDPKAAGHELGVDVVLDGLVQRSDKTVRVSVQMLRVSDGAVLWGEKFDNFFTNIFAVQDSISEKMAEALSLRLTSREEQLLTRRYTENTEAYQLYLQGMFYHVKLTRDAIAKAHDFYQAAIAKDPEYPLPYTALVGLYVGWANAGINRQENRQKARAAADKAISLDPHLAEAHDALGSVKFVLDWDFSGAERSFQRAIELNPRNALVRDNYVFFLSSLGRHEEAIRQIEIACQLDPVSAYLHNQYAKALYQARRYEQAIEQAQKALELDPQFLPPHLYIVLSHVEQSRHAEATAAVERAVALGGSNKPWVMAGYVQARVGNRAEAESILEEYKRNAGQPGYRASQLALLYCGLGDRDRAFEWLEIAYREREVEVLYLKVGPEWDNLRPDSRFKNLLRRVGLPE